MGMGQVRVHPRKAKEGAFAIRVARPLFFASFCCAAASLAVAQSAPRNVPQDSAPKTRLLTAKQGREIVSVAREHDSPERGTQDCSHLIHEIYAKAGFAYPYASSFEIYAGSENFARVKNPQPGDLVVWPGHAGIVFEPKQHIFYSLVSTGLDTEDYESPYWRSRGRPRFFRYVVARNVILTASNASASAPGNASRVTGQRSSDDAPGVEGLAKEASERSAVRGAVDPETPTRAVSVPRSIVIAAKRKSPTREEVAEGISELSNATGDTLRSGDSFKDGGQVVVFEQLRVESIEIKRDHGWAFVQMDSRASLATEQMELTKHSEQVRWELRRGNSGWEAVMPAARTYVPRKVAVRALAARLAELTQSNDGIAGSAAVRSEESQLARVLSALLEENSER
jgi:hypothetical protein